MTTRSRAPSLGAVAMGLHIPKSVPLIGRSLRGLQSCTKLIKMDWTRKSLVSGYRATKGRSAEKGQLSIVRFAGCGARSSVFCGRSSPHTVLVWTTGAYLIYRKLAACPWNDAPARAQRAEKASPSWLETGKVGDARGHRTGTSGERRAVGPDASARMDERATRLDMTARPAPASTADRTASLEGNSRTIRRCREREPKVCIASSKASRVPDPSSRATQGAS